MNPWLLFLVLLILLLPLPAQATDISQSPMIVSVEPNLVFILDDSDSTDLEVLFNGTTGGILFWNTNTSSYTNGATPWLGPTNGWCSCAPYVAYTYLFPNGNGNKAYSNFVAGAKHLPDASTAAYSIPPVPAFAWVRDYEYNPLYYNPYVTYSPWAPAYINTGSNYYSNSPDVNTPITFSNIDPTAAPSDPTIPGSPRMNLTVTQNTNATDKVFYFSQGMTIPGGMGIVANINNAGWVAVNSDKVLSSTQTAYANVPYFPATYYVKDPTCVVAAPTCATGPDGSKLRMYRIAPDTTTYPSGRSYNDEIQNFANWFTYYRKRRFMLAGAMGIVLTQTKNLRVALVTEMNVSRGVTTSITMSDLNSTVPGSNEAAVLGAIDTNQSAIINLGSGYAAAHYALNFVGQQMMNNKSIINYACQANAAMFITDGYPDMPPVISSSFIPALPAYLRTTWGSGQPYQTTPANSIADIALYYYTTNLRPDLTPTGKVPINNTGALNADTNPNLHLNTYAFSLADRGTIYGTGTSQALFPFTYYPTWPTTYPDGSPQLADDTWHATINSRGQMYNAQNLVATARSLQYVIAAIFQQVAASSPAGVANPNITASNNTAFIASYYGNTGNLLPYTINISTGAVTPANTWNSQALLDSRTSSNRLIATYDGSTGQPFQWANLPASLRTRLNSPTTPPGPNDGQAILNWERGDHSLEGTVYRTRTHLLGDLVNAQPVIVSKSQVQFSDSGFLSYSNSVASRAMTVYQASNDGMLHAFDVATGQENWAYIPSFVLANIPNLAAPTYSHQFFVDGTPTVGDVAINNGTNWRTLLVGGLNAGGKGFYALDITSPTATNETLLASKVLWEFPNASTPLEISQNVGLSFGKPVIAKTKAMGWVVLVTSGYNNTSGDGQGHLFVLNPDTGAVIADLKTGQGTPDNPSGLAKISGFAPHWNYDATIDYVYGGDLYGNLWRFDLSGDTQNSWNVKLLAQLTDASGNAQPITATPQLSTVGSTRLVYVGTGKLLGETDVLTSSTQSMYALVDDMSASPTINNVRNILKKQTVNTATNTITNSPVNFQTNRGWFFDLPSGEMVTNDATIVMGSMVFQTNMPTAASCTSQSFEYLVDKTNGGLLTTSLFPQGTNPWSRRALTSSFASEPTVVVLPNGQLISIIHSDDNSISTYPIPSNINSNPARTIGWREVIM